MSLDLCQLHSGFGTLPCVPYSQFQCDRHLSPGVCRGENAGGHEAASPKRGFAEGFLRSHPASHDGREDPLAWAPADGAPWAAPWTRSAIWRHRRALQGPFLAVLTRWAQSPCKYGHLSRVNAVLPLRKARERQGACCRIL